MMQKNYSTAFRVQALHAFLCVLWNGIGLWQIQAGVQPVGPTASVSVILVITLLLASLALSLHRNKEFIYLLLSTIAFLACVSAIYGGFTKNPNLWPSEFWRFTGIILNIVGAIGFVMALQVCIQRKGKK